MARARVVILTWDPAHHGFWLVRNYFLNLIEHDRRITISHGRAVCPTAFLLILSIILLLFIL